MSLITTESYQPKSLRDQVVMQIREMIYSREIAPGSYLREQEFTKRLGISRTPLREAFILLERDGLVVAQPNRGLQVREFNDQDIEEIFAMRCSLEDFAAALLVPKFDDSHAADLAYRIEQQRMAIEHEYRNQYGPLDWDFHYYLVSRAGNSRLESFWHTISAQYQAVIRYRDFAYPDYDMMNMIRDHTRILEAYKSGDVAQVEAVNADINRTVSAESIEGWRIHCAASEDEQDER